MVTVGYYDIKSPEVYQKYFNSLSSIEEIYITQVGEETAEVQELDTTSGSGEFRKAEISKLEELISGGHLEEK